MVDSYLTYVSRDFFTLVKTMYKIHEHGGDSKKEILEKLDKKFKNVLQEVKTSRDF